MLRSLPGEAAFTAGDAATPVGEVSTSPKSWICDTTRYFIYGRLFHISILLLQHILLSFLHAV